MKFSSKWIKLEKISSWVKYLRPKQTNKKINLVRTLFNYHQRSFLPKQSGTNTDTHMQILYRFNTSLRSFFLMRDRNEVNLDMRGDSKELGAIKRVKTVMRIYYVKKKSLFSTNWKEKMALRLLLEKYSVATLMPIYLKMCLYILTNSYNTGFC